MNLFRGEADAPSFRALNPNGLVPVLVDGDFVLWESNAILTYLATTHPTPSLLPTEARQRADVERWLHWQSAHLAPALSRIAFERFVEPMTRGRRAEGTMVTSARQDLVRYCAVLEASLVDVEYIAGRLTIADFSLACVLNTAAMLGLELEPFRRTQAWLRRMLARDSLERALADVQRSLRGLYEGHEFRSKPR